MHGVVHLRPESALDHIHHREVLKGVPELPGVAELVQEAAGVCCRHPHAAVHEPLQLIVLHLKGHGGTYWKAVRGLLAMLPDLARDRAAVARIRKLPDGALLRCEPLIVRDDLMTPLARLGKGVYDKWLAAYWYLLRHTVLAG